MDFSKKEFCSIVQELIKLSVQMDSSELGNYKAFIDNIKPSGNEILHKIKEDEYKQWEKRLQEVTGRLNKLL